MIMLGPFTLYPYARVRLQMMLSLNKIAQCRLSSPDRPGEIQQRSNTKRIVDLGIVLSWCQLDPNISISGWLMIDEPPKLENSIRLTWNAFVGRFNLRIKKSVYFGSVTARFYRFFGRADDARQINRLGE